MAGDAIARYLRDYAHGRPDNTWKYAFDNYDCVVVIPAYDEGIGFLERFAHTDFGCRALLIAVVNAPTDAGAAALERTRDLVAAGRGLLDNVWESVDGYAGDVAASGRALRVVDCVRNGRRLPPDQGVGLARKIGMDRALRWIALGRIATPLIWCSDADATLPANYFTPRGAPGEAALTFEFTHRGAGTLAAAQAVYDLRLRDYPSQLARAGSPYGYLALGSVLAVSALGYAQVRGMPRRAAGEDFHLLNKLAKVGRVRSAADIRVALDARVSRRVPFGTGPGVRELSAHDDPQDVPFFYAPRTFDLLRRFLQVLEDCARTGLAPADRRAVCERLANVQDGADTPHGWWEAFDPDATLAALRRACAAGGDACVRRTHLHTWFDALRTLRAVHRLRDGYCPNVSARSLRQSHPQRVRAALAPRTGHCGVPAGD